VASRPDSVRTKTGLMAWKGDCGGLVANESSDWIMPTKPMHETLGSRPAEADRVEGGASTRRFWGRAAGFAGLASIGLAGLLWAYHWSGRSAPDVDAIWARTGPTAMGVSGPETPFHASTLRGDRDESALIAGQG
jgi:hypothetical protein